MSMRAKINFYALKVGEHTNILKFIGAVFDDNTRKFHWVKYSFHGGYLKKMKLNTGLLRFIFLVMKNKTSFQNINKVHIMNVV